MGGPAVELSLPSTETVIELSDLAKTYRLGDVDVHALRGVSLRVRRGEFVAVMGASGCGKTTLMNIIGGLDKASAGVYRFEGRDISTLDEPSLARIRSRRIGFVFQSFNLLARTSAIENVTLPLLYAGAGADNQARGVEMLHRLGLQGHERSTPNQLSGGQQQRVALARALINDPAVLLADEPTGNLDSKTAAEIMTTLQALNQERGLTIILVTHEPDMAAFAGRIVTMRDGLVLSDTPAAGKPAPSSSPVSRDGAAAFRERDDAADLGSFAAMAFFTAARALARNKMRAALTMLGVFIGVAALIAMVAVGAGANEAVKKQIESLGTNMLIVLPGATTASGVRAGFGSASTLTTADADAIAKEAPSVARVSYQIRQVAQVQYGGQNWSTSLQGVTPDYLAIRNWNVVAGRTMSDADQENAERVCLLGRTVVKNLFGESVDAVGVTVQVKGVAMTVIGVLATKGQSGYGQDQDDVVLIPFNTAERKVMGTAAPTQTQTNNSAIFAPRSNPFGNQPKLTGIVNIIYVQALATELVQSATDEASRILRHRHRIQPGTTDDFGVRNMADITAAAEGSSRIMALLLASVASISLAVGGIGIMNILLVSVTERTREIGIRIAIGARRLHILLQFLVEAVLLSVLGGLAGIIAGIAASQIISKAAGWPVLLSPVAIVGGFLFSAAVGVFFGYYPARKAAMLNPIEALRYE